MSTLENDKGFLLEDPAPLYRALKNLVATVPLQKIYPVSASGMAPPPGTRSQVPRLTMVLRGTRHVAIPTRTGLRTVLLRPGSGIFVTDDSWTKPEVRQPHRYVSIDFYPQFTRFRLQRTARPAPDDGAFHSERPLNPVCRSLLQALEHLAPLGEAERMIPIMSCLLSEIIEDCQLTTELPAGQKEWQAAVAWMLDSLAQPIGRDHIAAAVGVHPNHLSRLCRRFTGQSLSMYLGHQRMVKARQLLRAGLLTVAEVAKSCGYHDVVHFRKRFRQLVGETPGSYARHIADQA